LAGDQGEQIKGTEGASFFDKQNWRCGMNQTPKWIQMLLPQRVSVAFILNRFSGVHKLCDNQPYRFAAVKQAQKNPSFNISWHLPHKSQPPTKEISLKNENASACDNFKPHTACRTATRNEFTD
jgi:hypothetical protein